jgi:putative ABC transport system ATP-binding protein
VESASDETNSKVLVETRGLSRHYRMGETEVAALTDVSLRINRGEFVAIQGTSGSGKSTLLNLLGALDSPSAGEILFDGKPLATTNKSEIASYRRRSVGMIFQNFNLIPGMSAEENVELALAFGGKRGRVREELARGLLNTVGLADRTTHRPSELSGGEQQRVAIARALANEPKLLLADEPTGNLDSTRANELLILLKEMIALRGLTIVMVTHDRELAERFANRTIMMRDGRVLNQ